MPGARTPAGPPASHPIDAFVWASVSLTTSPPALMLLTRLIFASGWCGHPSGLQHTLSTLHRCCSPVLADPFRNHRSASSARLDRGGWLALTPRGLSPRQKCQASLDALTTQLS